MRKAQEVLTQALGATSTWTIDTPRDGRQKECYIASDGARTVFLKFAIPLPSLRRLSELAVAPRVLASGVYQGESYVIQEFLVGAYPDRPWLRSHIMEVAERMRTYHEDQPLATLLAHGDDAGAAGEDAGDTRSYRQRLDDDLAALELRVVRHAQAPLHVAFAQLSALAQSFDDAPLVPVHNEPNTKNMLVHDGTLLFLDWDEVLLADPLRDIGPFLWWYVPLPQWHDFFTSYGAPLPPAVARRVYWFAARASLAICLTHLEHGNREGTDAFAEDFLAALDQQPNPHAS